jgi:hypothetical protein
MRPLHKKKSVADPRNYRGVHLTAQTSKVIERVIAPLWVPDIIAKGIFGEKQFAYT